MMRTLQLLILILGIIGAAMIASCSVRGAGSVVSSAVVERELRSVWPSARVTLEDGRYECVAEAEVRRCVRAARVPYRDDVADCDDLTADAVGRLRRARYFDLRAVAPPAAGRLTARWLGESHSFVWWLDLDSSLRCLEPMSEVRVSDIQATTIFDK
jgi:hypothetical protein